MTVSTFDFAVLDEFFRDPQDILESNSLHGFDKNTEQIHPYITSHFFKNHF